MKDKYVKLFVSLLFVGIITIFSNTAVSASINLPDLDIPENTNFVFTPEFKITRLGQMKIVVRIKTTVAGNAGYRIQLLRGRTVVRTRNVNALPFYKTIELNENVSNCNQIGKYKIRIKNLSSSPKPGKAVFPPFDPPGTGNCRSVPRFANQMAVRIPHYLFPPGF